MGEEQWGGINARSGAGPVGVGAVLMQTAAGQARA
jgi:hypothetical protein